MRVTGTDLIETFVAKHRESAPVFARWLSVVQGQIWAGPMQVKQTFNHADFLGGGRIIFNIGGNKYRLVAIATYTRGVLDITFVGTHAEYDKLNFKK